MRKAFWIMLIACLPPGRGNCSDSEVGSISGVIVNSDGRPVPGVKVYALNPKVATAGKIIYFLSDSNGSFRVDGAVPGINMICTTKPEDFYPDTAWGINSPPGKEAPTVDVRAGQTVLGVRVVIYAGRKIKGIVRDAITGGALKSRFIMNRAGAPEYYQDDAIAADGAFSYVVPTVPMDMRVKAQGYRDWTMSEPSDGGGSKVGDARTVKEIEVRLRRIP